ncbi:MAG: histidine kinase N-terminal 7TM domain-containing protein [Vicinamibacterales bacterium]
MSSWLPPLLAVILVIATGMSVWSAMNVRSRRAIPGSPAFAWLMLVVAHWCLMSALHTLVDDVGVRIAIAKVRYLAVATVPPLWLFFTSGYARVAWPGRPGIRAALWIVPIITVALAVTNEAHGLIWSAIVQVPTPFGVRLRYESGPWYGVHATFSYAVWAAGTWMLAAATTRHYPPAYQPRRIAVAAGLVLPAVGHLLFLVRLRPSAGFDVTPLALAMAGMFFTWGLYRYRLFGLVPIARDMVVDSMEDGVLILDAERRIIEMNAAAERLTGCTPVVVGRPIEDVVAWWTDGVAESSPRSMPAVVRLEPGPRYLEVRLAPVRDRERHFNGWLVQVRDITSRRRAEADRRALERRVQEQQRSDSLTVFAAGVAHDFNNLLTGILGNADLLSMQAPPDSTQRRTAEAIVIGSQRAADLVSKMLAYAGEGRVVPERVDLDALVREMVEVMTASVTRHCTLVYNGSGPLPVVDADPTQVRQVVVNLIVNATEAVDDGGLVTVATGRESLDRETLARMTFGTDSEPGSYVFVDVVDNGVGMSEDTLARIFEPFYSTKETGRGLGLAAVRGIVRSHRAVLRVTTAPGQGTRFRVWLPLMPALARPATS